MLLKIDGKKLYSEKLEIPLKLRTFGVQIPSIAINKLLREYFSTIFDNEWKKKWCGKTLRDYCFHITLSKKYEALSDEESERCKRFSQILKEGVTFLREDLKRTEDGENLSVESTKELYWQILGLLRAVECLERKEFRPITASDNDKVEKIKRELRFLKKAGALNK